LGEENLAFGSPSSLLETDNSDPVLEEDARRQKEVVYAAYEAEITRLRHLLNDAGHGEIGSRRK